MVRRQWQGFGLQALNRRLPARLPKPRADKRRNIAAAEGRRFWGHNGVLVLLIVD